MKVSILSLGCPKNLVDSEVLLGEFTGKGHEIVDEAASADVVILNTCAFIEDAKKESIDTILELIQLKKEGRIKKLIVTGCLPKRYEKALRREFEEVDEFRGMPDFEKTDKQARILITPRHYTYIKISEGCDNICNYCIISKIRGRYRSRTIESIEKEFAGFKSNTSEINLISQDTTYFGKDLYGKPSLAVLLDRLSAKSGKADKCKWLRLLYCHPAHMEEDVLDIISGSPLICKYIDLPVQHINDRILKAMNRKTTKKKITGLIEKIRKKIPAAFIRSTLIVGLPGETEKEYKELLEFIKDVKFERLGIFTYSQEEGTPAYRYPKQVPEKTKEDRLKQAMRLQQKVSQAVNSRLLGRVLTVLIDEKDPSEEGLYLARTQWDAPEVDGQVFVRSKRRLSPGDFVDVTITDTLEYDLVGICHGGREAGDVA